MRLLPPEPNVGDRITAELIRELIRCVRERQLLRTPDYDLDAGPNGTKLKIKFPKAVTNPNVDNGCWIIVAGEQDGESVRQFGNQFYEDGEHNLNELELTDAVEDFVCQGELEEGEEYTANDKPFVCLKAPATTTSTESPVLVGYADISELQTAQSDVAYIVKPLYKFTHDGSIKVDFRNCPFLQVSEALP